jgi:hypothetical protein
MTNPDDLQAVKERLEAYLAEQSRPGSAAKSEDRIQAEIWDGAPGGTILEDDLRALLQSHSEMERGIAAGAEEIANLRGDADGLHSRVKQLRAALEPFRAACALGDAFKAPILGLRAMRGALSLTDFRQARAAYDALNEDEANG